MVRCIALLLVVSMCGCSSFKSTLLTRDESNMHWQSVPRLKGVPITVKVPTHLKVIVFEKHFFHNTEKGPERLEVPVVIRDFDTEVINTEKMFTVDFKRPAAGSIEMTAEFEEQYFKKIEDKVVDETIDDVANLLSKTIPLLTPTVDTGDDANLNDTQVGKLEMTEVKSVVAVGVFEFDEPDFEEQVMGFINCHVNNSHNALTVPPGVSPITRLPDVSPIMTPSCNVDGSCITIDHGY